MNVRMRPPMSKINVDVEDKRHEDEEKRMAEGWRGYMVSENNTSGNT